MSRQTIHSVAALAIALALITSALVLASSSPMHASPPALAVPQEPAAQTPPTTTGECAPLELDAASSRPTQSDNTAARTIPPRQNFSGLQNFAQINPTLYRGGRPTEEGLACLAKMGVTIVISLEGKYKDLRKPVERLGMQYVSMFWECSFPKDEIFAKFLQLLRDNPGKKVFVYCHYGDDRTSMMIAAYRMAEQGWSAHEAKDEMKAFGFDSFHRRICTGLSDYEEHFPQHWREHEAFEKLRSTTPPQP
jgi:tyrosine-protein phosphatase SIW14